MARVKHYLLVSVAAAALATSAAAPARAQYHYYKSEKPNVEIDLGALSGGALAPTAPPQQDTDGHAPPVVLRQPLPPAAPVAAAMPASDEPAAEEPPAVTAAQAPMPVAAPAADIPPRRVVKPLFSEPVAPPPALREAAPVTPAAAAAPPQRQIEPQLTAAPAAEPSPAPVAPSAKAAAATAPADMPPAKLMAPILEPMPAAAMHPLRKPVRASVTTHAAPKPTVDAPASVNAADNSAAPVAAPAVKSAAPSAPPSAGRMSYPPAARPAADIQRFERPVLPEGLRADEQQAPPLRQAAPLNAPAADISAPPAEETSTVNSKAAQQRSAPAEHSPAPQAAIADLPVRKPHTEELPQTVLSDDDMAALPETADAPEMKLDSQASYHRTPAAAETPEAPVAPPAGQAQRPSLVVVDTAAAADTLPRRQPVTTTLDVPADAPQTAATPAAKPEAPAAPAKRESLMPLTEDEAEALLATRPAPKPVENIRPPLTAAELENASRNIEAVPARVALAPPAPQPKDIGVPTMADLTLEFAGTSSDLTPETQQKLVNIIPLLQESKARRLAVHAYAAGEDGSKTSARRISLSRALAVRSFLMDNGVEPTRVDVRALGLETDRKPLERVDLVFAH